MLVYVLHLAFEQRALEDRNRTARFNGVVAVYEGFIDMPP